MLALAEGSLSESAAWLRPRLRLAAGGAAHEPRKDYARR